MQRVTSVLYKLLAAATLLLLAGLFITPFASGREIFGGLLGSKLLRIEQIALPLSFTLALLLLFSKRLEITLADMMVMLFLLWCGATEVFLHSVDNSLVLHHLYTYMLWGMIYIALRMVTAGVVGITTLTMAWIAATLVMTLMGLGQLYGRIPSNHNLFPTTGPFHNPGPFAGWIVAALPAVFAIILATLSKGTESTKQMNHAARNYNIEIGTLLSWSLRYLLPAFSVLTFFVVLLILPPAGSRAAWIAAAGGLLYVVWFYPGKLDVRDKFRVWFGKRSRLQLIMLTLLFAMVVLAGSIGLYNLKRDSANGRVLNWWITTGLIAEKPITGYGSGAFLTHFMSRQSEWFASGNGTPEMVMVAGSPNSPFNELLHIWLKKGVVAVILLLILLWLLLGAKYRGTRSEMEGDSSGHSADRDRQMQWLDKVVLTGLKGTLISVLLFAQFSYPMNISSFVLQVIVITALLAGRTATVISFSGLRKFYVVVPLSLAIATGAVLMLPQRREHYKAASRWKEAHRLYSAQAYDYSAALYSELFKPLRHDGIFLQMYGKTLNMAGRYEESNDMLKEAERYMSSQIISIAIGDNYRALGDIEKAEEAYRKAAWMMPYMLYPRYQLAQMYVDAEMYEKAVYAAREILDITIKVETSASKDMIRHMEDIVEQYGNK